MKTKNNSLGKFIMQKKALSDKFYGMERLLPMGGFIAEYVLEMLGDIYPGKVVNALLKYADAENGFWQVLKETEKAFYEITDYEITDMGNVIELWSEEFGNWYIENTARVAAQYAKEKPTYFWEEWPLCHMSKRMLGTMPALDRYVLSLQHGLDGTENRTEQEIASLPEFEGNEHFIHLMFKRIEWNLEDHEVVNEEFTQVCDFYRAEKAKEKNKE